MKRHIRKLRNLPTEARDKAKERIKQANPIERGFYTNRFNMDVTVHPRSKRPKLNIQRYGI